MKYAATITLATALPATADEYYVIPEETSRECKIVTERPRETTWLQVGDVSFKSREEADDRIKVLCRDDDDDGATVVEHHRHDPD